MAGTTKHETSLAQGAFFIVDNAGPCPSGIDLHDFQNRKIKDHLKSHSYVIGKSREPVSLTKMRQKMNNLAGTSKVKAIYQPEAGETRIDAFFRLGSTPIPPEVLSRYGYDRTVFLEADLPASVGKKAEVQDVRADPTPAQTTTSAGSKESKRKHAETADSDGTSEEPSKYVSNGLKPAKRQALGKRKKDVSHDGEPALRLQSVKEKKTSKELRQTSGNSIRTMTQDPVTVTSQYDAVPLSSTLHETIRSEPHGATSSPTPSRPQDIQRTDHVDIDELQRQLHDLRGDVREAAGSILTCIGRIDDLSPALDPYPSEDLKALFVRCWGKEWKQVYTEAVRYNAFHMEFVTMTLISAFLYDHILCQQALAQNQIMAQTVKDWMLASGSFGEECLRRIDLQEIVHAHVKIAHDKAIEKARTTLAQNQVTHQAEQLSQAQQLTKTLWHTLLPYLRRLRTQAELRGWQSSSNEGDWLKNFEAAMITIIEKTLDHNLQLLATGHDCTYTWPSSGDSYDQGEMKPLGVEGTLPLVVRFTLFPGLQVKLSEDDHAHLENISKATVRTKRP